MSVELVRLVHHPWYEPGLAGVDLVVAETYVLLRRAAGCRAAISFLELVGASPRIKKLYSDPKLKGEAERILRHYTGQGFSFVDAVSFAAMKRERIEEAFAFDRHFLIMGFRTVPPSPASKTGADKSLSGFWWGFCPSFRLHLDADSLGVSIPFRVLVEFLPKDVFYG